MTTTTRTKHRTRKLLDQLRTTSDPVARYKISKEIKQLRNAAGGVFSTPHRTRRIAQAGRLALVVCLDCPAQPYRIVMGDRWVVEFFADKDEAMRRLDVWQGRGT